MLRNADSALEVYQGNVYPGMLDVLAREFGLEDPSHLTRLGLGFAPIVPTKYGPNGEGWWIFPERDAHGRIIGLSTRNCRDGRRKGMIPASTHGLFYAMREGYVPNQGKGYKGGAHNWRRTMDAGVLCPICQKPDGCVVAADNPDDPKAAICIRVKEGSTKETGMGFLHIRKPEGLLGPSGNPLPDSEYPVIVVEGASDAVVAMDLGFVSVGRPSNRAGLAMLRELVQGRPVIIIGENDVKVMGETVRYPGKEGMEAAFHTLKPFCKDLIKVMPPADVKDLRAWRGAYGLTRDLLLEYAKDYGETESDSAVFDSSDPQYIANRLLAARYTEKGVITLRFWNGGWFRYTDGQWIRSTEQEIKASVYDYLEGKYVIGESPTGDQRVAAYKVSRARVGDILEATWRRTLLNETPPCWLSSRPEPNPRHLLCFPNGIIDTDEYVETGRFRVFTSEPDLFHLSHRPFAFDPTAQCPLWQKFLDDALPETDKQALLQEWFGLNLIPDNSLEKLMLLYGLRRSGKGSVLTVLRAVLGSDNVASTNFQQLGEKYGLETLVGRLAAHIGDARLSARGVDSMASLETLLTVVGNDTVGVRRMAKDTLANIHLYARFTIATNDIPTFPDHAGALEARMLPLHFNVSFADNPDTTLKERLIKEAPAILVWSLRGLKRLRDNGNQFTIPESSRLLIQQIRYRMSPITEFMDECLFAGAKENLKTRVAYGAYRNWAQQSGLYVGSYTWFKETVAKQSDVEFEDRGQSMVGVCLTEAGKRFLTGGM